MLESLTAYSFTEWLLFFYIYCFCGWCFETTYVSLKQHAYVNRGFLHGPMLPIYGSGAIVMLFAAIPVKDHPVLVYIFGLIGATALEYVVGASMEKIFKVRYWDYSYQKFNLNGHICLSSSIAWGFFTCAMIYKIHTPFETFVMSFSDNVKNAAAMLVTFIMGADFVTSLRTALDLRDLLIQAEKMRTEVEHMKRRVEIIETFARADLEEAEDQIKENLSKRFEEMEERVRQLVEESVLADGIRTMKKSGGRLKSNLELLEKRTEELHAYLLSAADRTEESRKHLDEISSLHMRINAFKEGRQMLMTRDKLRMLKRNPSARYAKFPEYLEEIQEEMERYLEKLNIEKKD